MQARNILVQLVVLGTLTFFAGVSRAELFTYDINAATGFHGTTLSGTITFTGNAGDSATVDPSFDDVSSFDIFWTYAPGETDEWNPGDIGSDFSNGATYDNALGAPVLTPTDGYIEFETMANGSPTDVELGFDGRESSWEVVNNGRAVQDFGDPLTLTLPSVAATPLPSTFSMAALGLPALGLWRWLKSRRQVA